MWNKPMYLEIYIYIPIPWIITMKPKSNKCPWSNTTHIHRAVKYNFIYYCVSSK